ncbi:MAG: SPOR domain-containing protein [Candidatus Zixiibacteriota bacterium]
MLACLVAVIVFPAAHPNADILSLIEAGRLDDARDSISALSSTFAERHNMMFYQALLEPNADSSARLFQAALSGSLSEANQEVIAMRLAFYKMTKGDIEGAQEQIAAYMENWPHGRFAAPLARLSIMGYQEAGELDSAAAQVDDYLKQYARTESYQWGVIDRGRLGDSTSSSQSAAKLLKKLSQEQSGAAIPVALAMLAERAAKAGQTDDAVRYFTLLKEAYPHAVGLSSVAEMVGDLPDQPTKDTQAEKITGTYYAIRVGIFAQKENADRQAERCRRDKLPFTIDTKDVSGKLYYVVYVGRFRSFAEAEQTKEQLESEFGETYQVTAR